MGIGGRARRGDEDAAPFYESADMSPALCLMFDSGNKLIWSGHKDGKIRSWRTDQPISVDSPFKEGLSWNAHRGPVLSLMLSSYGNICFSLLMILISVYHSDHSIEILVSLRFTERSGLLDFIILSLRYVIGSFLSIVLRLTTLGKLNLFLSKRILFVRQHLILLS